MLIVISNGPRASKTQSGPASHSVTPLKEKVKAAHRHAQAALAKKLIPLIAILGMYKPGNHPAELLVPLKP